MGPGPRASWGAGDLDPRGDAAEFEAAAALCRSAGDRALVLSGGRTPVPPLRTSTSTAWSWWRTSVPAAAVAHLEPALERRWTLAGRCSLATARPADEPPARKPAFATRLDLLPDDSDNDGSDNDGSDNDGSDNGVRDAALGLAAVLGRFSACSTGPWT